jgi:hypothetical protein|tara:strand:- start:38 stop:193 length:156 start_codon:yes stop_codon:yes gene_type:complete
MAQTFRKEAMPKVIRMRTGASARDIAKPGDADYAPRVTDTRLALGGGVAAR